MLVGVEPFEGDVVMLMLMLGVLVMVGGIAMARRVVGLGLGGWGVVHPPV